jgi:hypothetical protein
VTTHTDPQVVIQRLTLHLTCIASPSEERLFFALTARGSGSRRDSGRRSHFVARRMDNKAFRKSRYGGGWKGSKRKCQRATGVRGERRTLEHIRSSGRTMTTPASLHESTNERDVDVRGLACTANEGNDDSPAAQVVMFAS